jgi:hypothetical protein
MLRRVVLVKTEGCGELIASIIMVILIGEPGTLAVTSNQSSELVPSWPVLVTLMMVALYSPETSVLTRARLRNITEDGIIHSYRRKSIIFYIEWDL